MNIVYKGEYQRGMAWSLWLEKNAPDLSLYLWPEVGDPHAVDVLITWQPLPDMLACFPNLKLIISSGAGAEQFDLNTIPAYIPLVRMIEPGLTQGMVEYVTFAVLGLHRDIPCYFRQQAQQIWQAHPVHLSCHRKVGVMGLGVLGQAVLQPLVSLGFQCHGWSRTPRELVDVTCWHGTDQLNSFLQQCDILVCLLPLTAATRGILNKELFDQMPHGASLVHVGRGAHLNEKDLVAALESGSLSSAVIDVSDPEPLVTDHPFWKHPDIWLTPHIASQTQTDSAIKEVLKTLRRFQHNEPLKGVINRERGY